MRRLDDYLDPARVAVDVGTWWGPWTAALAERCPAVHSFEPQPQLAGRLRDWAPDHVSVHEAAVGEVAGSATLFRPDPLPGTDGLATLREGVGGDRVAVRVVRLDDEDLGDVGFMKIDVEGFELPALRGAERTLERCRPRLMLEIEQRHLDRPIEDVFTWLAERDYAGWFLRADGWHRLEEFDVEADQRRTVERPKHVDYVNAFLFVPAADAWSPPSD